MSRQCVTNPYDKTVKITPGGLLSHDDFLRLIEPSLPSHYEDEDVIAVLRRANIIVCTPDAVVYRLASREQGVVPMLGWPQGDAVDLFIPEVREKIAAYRAGADLPASYIDDCVWSQAYLRRCVNGVPIPQTMTVRSAGLFGEEPSNIYYRPPLLDPAEQRVTVKRERAREVFRNLKTHHAVIVLDSDDDGGSAPANAAQSYEDQFDEAQAADVMQSQENPFWNDE
jgi:hypothetical protein